MANPYFIPTQSYGERGKKWLDFMARLSAQKQRGELTQKELLKTLRAKITWEQAKSELGITAKPAERLQEQRPQRDTKRPSSGRQYKKPKERRI